MDTKKINIPKDCEVSELQLRFELEEICNVTIHAISEIDRLVSDHRKSFMLNFDGSTSRCIIITTCNGPLKDIFFVLKERTKNDEKNVSRFNLAIGTGKVSLDFDLDINAGTLTYFIIPDSEDTKEHIKKIWKDVN